MLSDETFIHGLTDRARSGRTTISLFRRHPSPAVQEGGQLSVSALEGDAKSPRYG